MRKYLSLVIVCLIGYTFFFMGCDEAEQMMEPVITDEEIAIEMIDVLIYTGSTWWITPADAMVEAQITQSLLQAEGIQAVITEGEAYVRDWMLQTASDGSVNVLILYGVIPNAVYPARNTQPDGSVAENWIESQDGNTILNHADYFGWNSTDDPSKAGVPPDEWSQTLVNVGSNRVGTLRNLMDLPNITINNLRDNIPMGVTEDGTTLTPSLVGFESDRPFPLNQLRGEWFAEKILASNTGNTQATLADPVIVRDGNRGRLAIVHQAAWEDNPKAEVASEIIINYLLNPNVEFHVPSYVAFPDTNLARKMREALNLPDGAAISKAQLATLKVLDASSQTDAAPEEKIRDLIGLEHATDLRELYLHYNRIADIGLLAGLTQLTKLNIAANEIRDMTPLSELTNLTDLALGSNRSRDISPLAGLTKLTKLDLWNSQIRDISPLAGLTQLTNLGLSFNEIWDINSLARLTELTELYLNNNQIRNLNPLTRLTKLRHLTLGDNNISNINPLRRLSRLKTLVLNGNQISDVSALAGLVNLEAVFLDGNPIMDITPLRTLLEKNPNVLIISQTIWVPDPNLRAAVREALSLPQEDVLIPQDLRRLTYLNAFGKKISNIMGLEYATQLTRLNLGSNQISDISPIAALTQLTLVNFDANEISDISPLAGLTQLTDLVLSDNEISDISPLAELTQLTGLILDNNDISDIAPLTGLTQLFALHLQHNEISDITAISGLVNLGHLFLTGNPITDEAQFQSIREKNPDVLIHFDFND